MHSFPKPARFKGGHFAYFVIAIYYEPYVKLGSREDCLYAKYDFIVSWLALRHFYFIGVTK